MPKKRHKCSCKTCSSRATTINRQQNELMRAKEREKLLESHIQTAEELRKAVVSLIKEDLDEIEVPCSSATCGYGCNADEDGYSS